MIRSLRLRLLLATSVASAAVLALLCVSVYAAMWHLLLSDYDAALLAQARTIASTAEQREGRVHPEFDPKQMPEFAASERPKYFELWLDDGQVLRRSDSLRGTDLPSTPVAARATAGKLVLPGTRHGRAVVLTFTPRADREREQSSPLTSAAPLRTCTIAVAGTPWDAWRLLGYLGWLLLILCSTAILLSGGILLRVVSRGVRPVKSLAEEIEGLREFELAYRLSDSDVPTELAPIVEKLNGLLDRLQKAFARETAFTADVAHELRTPLAGLITTLEVCRSRTRQATEYEAAIDECTGMAERMQAMVENLLMLCRADAGHLAVKRQRVDVGAMLRDLWSMFEHRAEARRLDVQWQLVDRSAAEADPPKLQIVIQNLFDNAVSYANERGRIRISTARREKLLLVEIVNSGSAVAASDTVHVFDRFWRGDVSRSQTGVHCGLGLSLTQRLVRLLGGEITVETTAGGDFAVRLTLPASAVEIVAPPVNPPEKPSALRTVQVPPSLG